MARSNFKVRQDPDTIDRLVIVGGRVLDPGRWDGVANVWIDGGKIEAIVSANTPIPPKAVRIDAGGLLVLPGFVDLHAHLREPGFEYKETIASGTAAAVAGGFTSLCCMPNTRPVNDSVTVTRFIVGRAREAYRASVYPVGAITKRSLGRELADYGALKDAGCVAVSDDGRPVMDDRLMRAAMTAAADANLPVIDHCEDLGLSRCGCMNEGLVSSALGVRGMPAKAEARMVERDIRLARETGVKLHVAHVSTASALDAIRRAKDEGISVTAEVCPHHFSLTDGLVRERQASAKMNPPLRSEDDRAALIDGLADGTIDAIATDHAPHAEYETQRGIQRAPFGIVGLETALGLTLRLVQEGRLPLERAIACLTSRPASIVGLAKGTLRPGADADVTLVDPRECWTVDPETFHSKARNTPFGGWMLTGRVVRTLVRGATVYRLSTEETGKESRSAM